MIAAPSFGRCFAFDHRVFDGYAAGRILGELESVLNREIIAELRQPPEVRAAFAEAMGIAAT